MPLGTNANMTLAMLADQLSKAPLLSNAAAKLCLELAESDLIFEASVVPPVLYKAISTNLAAFPESMAKVKAAAFAATVAIDLVERNSTWCRTDAAHDRAARVGLYKLLQVASEQHLYMKNVAGSPAVRNSGACPAESACSALANLIIAAPAAVRREVFENAGSWISSIVSNSKVWARSQRGACRIISVIVSDIIDKEEGAACARAFANALMRCIIFAVDEQPSKFCEDGWDSCFDAGTGQGRLAKALSALACVIRADSGAASDWPCSEFFMPMLKAIQKQLLLCLRRAPTVESFSTHSREQGAIVEQGLLETLHSNRHEVATACSYLLFVLSENERGSHVAGEMGLKLMVLAAQQPFDDCATIAHAFGDSRSGIKEASPASYAFHGLDVLCQRSTFQPDEWLAFAKKFVAAGGVRALEESLHHASTKVRGCAAMFVANLSCHAHQMSLKYGVASPLRLDESGIVLKGLVSALENPDTEVYTVQRILLALHNLARSVDSKERCARAGATNAAFRVLVKFVAEPNLEASEHSRADVVRAVIFLIQSLSYLVDKEHANILGVAGGIEALVVALVEVPARALLGKCISVDGLVRRPGLNKERGILESVLPKGRVAVRLHGEVISVKVLNIRGELDERTISLLKVGFVALAELACHSLCAARIISAPCDSIEAAALLFELYPTFDEISLFSSVCMFLCNVAEHDGGAIGRQLALFESLIKTLSCGLSSSNVMADSSAMPLCVLSSIAVECVDHEPKHWVDRVVTMWENCCVFGALADLWRSPILMDSNQERVERLRLHGLRVSYLALSSGNQQAAAHMHAGNLLKNALELPQERAAAPLVMQLKLMLAHSAIVGEGDTHGVVANSTVEEAMDVLAHSACVLMARSTLGRRAAAKIAVGADAPSIPVHSFAGTGSHELEVMRSSGKCRGCANPRCPANLDDKVVFLKCKCRAVRYCGAACQREDFKVHKRTCSYVAAKSQRRSSGTLVGSVLT